MDKIKGNFCKILVSHTSIEDSSLLGCDGVSFGIS